MLEIKSIRVAYGKRTVLRDLSLSVRSGEITAIIGPNGAGKSTLIRAASGIQNILAGQVIVAGEELNGLTQTERARYLAVVPQARNLPGAYTVYQTVLLGRTPYLNWLGNAGKTDHERVRLALERTDTLGLADRRVGELSGGEQQRVLLARAFAQDTPILLLDEPTTHLDLQHQSNLLNLVRRRAREKDLTVVLVLHDLNLAGLYADQVALMSKGEIYALGSPSEVLTVGNLSPVYGVPVQVITHPEYGTPLILPDGRNEHLAN
ncbi:MAG: heme ABC transporter ATP-binding protein [Anaerolineales bacterium]|jgi:iron complex transport system ATP-binding protein